MDLISHKDFQKVDIRVGTVVEAVVPPWSHWVMKLVVDFGDEIGKRTIFAGIMHFFKPAELVGRQMPFVVNLEPKKIGPEGDDSQGMMMAAEGKLKKTIMVGDEQIEEQPMLFKLEGRVENGSKVI